MEDEQWLRIAKSLRAGQSVRVHCCKQDASMLVTHGRTGYNGFCFRCGRKEYAPFGVRSIADIDRANRELAELTGVKLALPKDFTLTIPPHAQLWGLKSGLDPYILNQYGIGYSELHDRVVIPIRNVLTAELEAVQLRALHSWQKPKYQNPTGPKVRGALFMSGFPEEHTVIVEDVLSAIKVGRGTHATSILGTTMTDERVEKIARTVKSATIWLDPDGAGVVGAKKAARQLQMQGIRTYMVTSDRDPKTYNADEILGYLRSKEEC